MDNAFSNLIPEYRIGRDGFNWWIGQIEKSSKEDPSVKGASRYKVRIVGEHLKDCEVVPTDDLPWAQLMMPANVPYNVGNTTGAHSQLKRGSWVVGFYLDPERQKPIIMGSIGQTPGATRIINEYQPGECNSFTTYLDPDINVAKDGLPMPANPKKTASSQTPEESAKRKPKESTEGGVQSGSTMFDAALAAENNAQLGFDVDLGLNYSKQFFGNDAGGFGAFTTDPDGVAALQTSTELSWGCPKEHDPPIPSAQVAPLTEGSQASEDWCQEKGKKCGPEDLKTTTTRLLGEFLAEVQRNNGNIGTYLVNQSTGGIYDAVYTARRYTNKFVFVVKHFVAKTKGFIIEKLTEGVEKLIKAVLRPDGTGNVLTPVTKWFNKQLKDLGCSMADIGERLIQWLTDLLMKLVEDVYQSVACQVDELVNGILAKLTSLMEDLIGKILGPLEDILGPIASALNLVGGAIAKVLSFLGITCTGPEAKCSEGDSECTNGEEKKKKNDFLDDLLDSINNDLFPDTSADYRQYRCEEAYEGSPLSETSVSFRGGVFDTNYTTVTDNSKSNEDKSYDKKIVYSMEDIVVKEGEPAVFTITRRGYLAESSSVNFKTIAATAQAEKDFVMADDIVGFAPNETSKTISIRTINDGDDTENDESFFARISLNTPVPSSGVRTKFEKGVATCTITQRVRDDVDEYDPYEEFTYTPGEIIEDIANAVDDAIAEEEVVDTFDDTNSSPQYAVRANVLSVSAGDFIIYTVTTRNVPDGTVLGYRLSQNFTKDDVVGGLLASTFVINNNEAKVTIGIEDDYESDVDQVLTFAVATTTASTDVLVLSTIDTIDDVDESVGDSIENVYTPPTEPTVSDQDVYTDDSGKIIEIKVTNPGGPYTEAPFVTVGGNGTGAAATALLDQDGFVTEIRVISGGYGYRKNLPENTGARCIIDTFTLLRPGAGYSSAPTIYINDQPGIAEAIINDDGFVIGARVLNREVTFTEIPKILIIGGGGYGAKLMPSLVCLPENALVEVGATKIGTGRYVDCP